MEAHLRSESVTGGRAGGGAPLGILMLETRFPRIPGDVGNVKTWPFRVAFKVVAGATPVAVVRDLSSLALLEPFLNAAHELEAAGAEVITTSCGFLTLFQRELQAHAKATVITSSLLQVTHVASLLPPACRVGILTIEASSLTPDHLRAIGVDDDADIAIQGVEEVGGYSHHVFIDDVPDMDVDRVRREHVDAARLLIQRHPDVGAIVLECANMPPYARAISAATRLPVYDLVTLVSWAVMARRPQSFGGDSARDQIIPAI